MIKNIGVFFNPQIIQKVSEKLKKFPWAKFYCLNKESNCAIDFFESKPPHGKLDMIVVFGGDGTILQAVDLALAHKAPILGVNLGNLGFLAECSPEELEKAFANLVKGQYRLQERMLLDVLVKKEGKAIANFLALNDAVFYKGLTAKLINVSIYNNKRFVLSTRCDGVIVSSPTGSTAYSLSAGGPILSPEMEAIAISPLNPHILSVRPLVFPAQDKIKLVGDNSSSLLQVDGKNVLTMEAGYEVQISKSRRKVTFIKMQNRTFFQILRKKMHMGKN